MEPFIPADRGKPCPYTGLVPKPSNSGYVRDSLYGCPAFRTGRCKRPLVGPVPTQDRAMYCPFSCYVGTAFMAVRPFGLSNSVPPFIRSDRDKPCPYKSPTLQTCELLLCRGSPCGCPPKKVSGSGSRKQPLVGPAVPARDSSPNHRILVM